MIGFTGTQKGMTKPQEMAVLRLLRQHVDAVGTHDAWFAHGDCIGADCEAHRLARRLGFHIHLFPPDKFIKRAFCDSDHRQKPQPYLVRNLAMVKVVAALIATPSARPRARSGTWYTINQARKRHIPIVVVLPSGDIK